MEFALSLIQPWAELVVSGRKTIELRTWNTKFRGKFFVHASMKTDKNKCKELGINPEILVNGAVIGSCELTDVVKYSSREELEKSSSKHFATEYKIPCYGFILKNAEKINPVECKGKLGFFTYTGCQ